MSKHSKKFQRSLEGLIKFNSSSYYTHFELCNFQRKYRYFFKFSILCPEKFLLRSKITKHSICITIVDINRYQVTYTTRGGYIEFTAYSGREIIEKLIKHQIY